MHAVVLPCEQHLVAGSFIVLSIVFENTQDNGGRLRLASTAEYVLLLYTKCILSRVSVANVLVSRFSE